MSGFRIEHDSMGEVRVPAEALWGAQTQRAVQNLPVSGLRIDRGLIAALGHIKAAAAVANGGLGVLDGDMADAIAAAAREVVPTSSRPAPSPTGSPPARPPGLPASEPGARTHDPANSPFAKAETVH